MGEFGPSGQSGQSGRTRGNWGIWGVDVDGFIGHVSALITFKYFKLAWIRRGAIMHEQLVCNGPAAASDQRRMELLLPPVAMADLNRRG